MTIHIRDTWTWDQDISQDMVNELSNAIFRNKCYDYTPLAFAILSIGDQLLINIAGILDRALANEETITEKYINNKIPDDFEYKEKAVEVIIRVIKELKMFDVPLKREVEEERKFDIGASIDWMLKHCKDTRWDLVERAVNTMTKVEE